jgi:hypothetical protein
MPDFWLSAGIHIAWNMLSYWPETMGLSCAIFSSILIHRIGIALDHMVERADNLEQSHHDDNQPNG